jgi:hypothetical protein
MKRAVKENGLPQKSPFLQIPGQQFSMNQNYSLSWRPLHYPPAKCSPIFIAFPCKSDTLTVARALLRFCSLKEFHVSDEIFLPTNSSPVKPSVL